MGERGPRSRYSRTSDLRSAPVADANEAAAIEAARERLSGQAGRRFFDAIVTRYAGWSPSELELLIRAGQATDRIEEAREQVQRDGIVVDGARGGQVRHPALAIERAALAELRALLKHLRLEEAAKP